MAKNVTRTRNVIKFFYVTEAEDDRIKSNMERAHLTQFSTFARKACLNKKIYQTDFTSLKKMISVVSQANFELNHIGTNLNQIAKFLNESDQNMTRELLADYHTQLHLLETKLNKIMSQYKGGLT